MIVTGNQNLSPETAITITIPVFVFASLAITAVGLLVGLVELVVLERRFKNQTFIKKVSYKLIIYLGLMLLIMLIVFPIATSIELETHLFDVRVWTKTGLFFQSLTFLNTLIQISFHLLLSLLYAAVSENLGHQVLYNFFTGKYHKPIEEERIFMFLDMKDSTGIAEKLGHVKYFNLLQDYYDSMSKPIIDTHGEVYQYIGDEVVVSWPASKGLANNNCLICFKLLKENLLNQSELFHQKYGVLPDFKAGIHMGEVTAGEIGALKKEIVFTGDVLNTTARIQSLCNQYKTDLIISNQVLKAIQYPQNVKNEFIGELSLKGKNELISLFSIVV